MTLVSQIPRVVIVGNGGLGPYSLVDENSVAIRFVSTAHVKLTRYTSTTAETGTELVLNTDFTVGGTQDARTFTLIGSQAVLTSSQRIVAERNQTYVQDLDLTTGGAFNAESVETRFDKVAEYLQELKKKVDRKLEASPLDSTPSTVPLKANATAGYVLVYDADKNLQPAAPTNITNADVALGSGWAAFLALTKPTPVSGYGITDGAVTVDTVTALQALANTAAGTAYIAKDYASAADGGGGVFQAIPGSSATADGHNVFTRTGGGRLIRITREPCLTLTGTADTNRDIINTALAAAGEVPKAILLPPGEYPISRTTSQAYSIYSARCGTLQAPFGKCFLVPDATVTTGINVIEVRPIPGSYHIMQEWSGVCIGSIAQMVTGPRNGAAGIYFNSQLVGSNPGQLKVTRCMIAQGSDVAILGVGDAAVVTDGTYCSEIIDNELIGGIDLSAWGDSIDIIKNKMSGTGRCWINTVNGASQVSVFRNNITVAGGIVFPRGGMVNVKWNNIENLAAGTGDDQLRLTAGGRRAVVAFTGSTGTVHEPAFENNNIGIFGSSEATCFVYFGDTFSGREKNNKFLDGLNQVTAPIEISVNADYTALEGRHVVGNSGDVTTLYDNDSLTTFGVAYEIALLNSWTVYGANFDQPLRATCQPNGDVHITGQISSGTTTGDTVIGVVPDFMIPALRIVREVSGASNDIYQVYIIGNDTPADAGKICVLDVSDATYLAFDIRFPAWHLGALVSP